MTLSLFIPEKSTIKCDPHYEGMDRRIIYGNKDFIDLIKRKYELEALVKPKGRPQKEEETNRAVPFYYGLVIL